MHYRHRFHAGNFADVFKHALLCGLLAALSRKDKPWSCLDTHAGAGRYLIDDGSDAALTGEWREGIGRLLEGRPAEPPPAMVARYLAIFAAESNAVPGSYPGSPRIAAAVARSGDRLVLCERVPEVAAELRAAMAGDGRVAIHVRDGYESAALLPPPEKRGLVLIDPPFEQPNEFEAIETLLARAAPRYAGGVFAIWYPLKHGHGADRFVSRVARATGRELLDLRLDTGAPATPREVTGRSGKRLRYPMTGCGLAIVGPPFGFEVEAREALGWLAPKLAQGPRPVWSVERHGTPA